jgi:hypothetical protein
MSQESQEMKAILQKLQDAESGQPAKLSESASEVKAHVTANPNSQEMFNILKKLEDATTNVAQTINEDRNTDSMTAVGIANRNSNITMGGYNVIMEKRHLIENFQKTFYDISDADGNILYRDISLFETAMSILKNLVTENTNKIKKIVDLDSRYNSYLTEAATHKYRGKMIKESYKKDVYSAKQSAAMSKAGGIKKQIKSLI